MSKRTKTSVNSIGCLVLHKVCGKHASTMQKEVEGFIEHGGVEWTCQRFKAIWNAANHLKNGDLESARKVYQSNSIAYHKSSMLPKGAWKWVVDQYVKAKKPSAIRRFAGVLRFYTCLTLDAPSKEQIQKFMDAVSEPAREGCTRKAGFMLAEKVSQARGCSSKVHMDRLFQNKFNLHGTSYYYSPVDPAVIRQFLDKDEQKSFDELLSQPYGKMLYSLATDAFVPTSLKRYLPNDNTRQILDVVYQINSRVNGRVVMMQQQGCKGRTVFQPSANLQVAFYPMARACEHIAQTMFPLEACWLDQQYGAYQAAELLSQGKPVFSVDQSSATDRFPRFVSEGVLDYFGMQDFSDALEVVCRRPWKCEFLNDQEIILATGQPMGLYGSFALYNLSNLMVAEVARQAVSEQIGSSNITAFPDGTCFKTVGDDIIFSDRNVAEEYRRNLDLLGVRVSELKSFSGKVAEFAGFLIVPAKGDSVTAFRPYKFPITDTRGITNPLDFLHMMGVSATKLKDPQWKLHYEAYQATLGQRTLDLAPFPYLRIPSLDGPEPQALTNHCGKDSSITSLYHSIIDAICVAHERGCKEEVVKRVAQCAGYSSDRWSERPEIRLRNTSVLVNHTREDGLDLRIMAYTGSKPEADTKPYDVYVRNDYARQDKLARKGEHHVAAKRLAQDPLIALYEYEKKHGPLVFGTCGGSSNRAEETILPNDVDIEVDDIDLDL